MVGRRLTPEQVDRLARGKLRLVPGDRSGPPKSLKLKKADMLAFQRAKELGYLLWRGAQGKLYELWWLWCDATFQPFAAAKIRNRRAFVEFELIDYEVELTDAGVHAIFRTLWNASPEEIFPQDRRCVCKPGVPAAGVEKLLIELLQIGRDCARPRQS